MQRIDEPSHVTVIDETLNTDRETEHLSEDYFPSLCLTIFVLCALLIPHDGQHDERTPEQKPLGQRALLAVHQEPAHGAVRQHADLGNPPRDDETSPVRSRKPGGRRSASGTPPPGFLRAQSQRKRATARSSPRVHDRANARRRARRPRGRRQEAEGHDRLGQERRHLREELGLPLDAQLRARRGRRRPRRGGRSCRGGCCWWTRRRRGAPRRAGAAAPRASPDPSPQEQGWLLAGVARGTWSLFF